MSFTQYKIKPGILKAIEQMKYTEATPIQAKVISAALEGKNIV
jgi:superfamily II DNA/RNA helicase